MHGRRRAADAENVNGRYYDGVAMAVGFHRDRSFRKRVSGYDEDHARRPGFVTIHAKPVPTPLVDLQERM
jgi:hypothetical protein